MADTMRHRGPDAQGIWMEPRNNSLIFVHRRLSIQDLTSAGDQPMASSSGRYRIVFNGEIYNFLLLAEELRRSGHRFRGRSDTEVLLAAVEEWGFENTLDRIRGMFAFALWDSDSGDLVLCRDRMGEKPLFFGWLNGCFAFSSELKALHAVFRPWLAVDYRALAAYFRFGYVPAPSSIYRNVYKLTPGTYLRVPLTPLPDAGSFDPAPGTAGFSPKPYWSLETVAREGMADPIRDENEAVEQLDALLRDAIRQQKIADVPLGAFLSGGVDSSLVAAIMQKVSDDPVRTFTIGWTEKEFDEAPYARAVAGHIGSRHNEFYISADDGLALVEDIPRYWDEPFADSSQIPTLLVARKARREVKVCLTGDGGDELFCGYNRYFATAELFSRKERFPAWMSRALGRTISSVSPQSWQRAYDLLKRVTGDSRPLSNAGLKIHKLGELMRMDSILDSYRYLMSYWERPGDVFSDPSLGEAGSVMDRQPDPGMGHFVHDAMYWDQVGYFPDDNLVKGDRASMATSLETRLPLADHRIVEFSWRLPLDMKYRDGRSKWLLRRLLYRYVPESLIERPKMGFSVPVREWLKGPLRDWAGDLLHSAACSDGGVLNGKTVRTVWEQHQNGSHDHSNKLWTLCMWLTWLSRYHGCRNPA